MRRVPTALIAALTLVVGFAVAELTGVRAAGGVALLGGTAWCVLREARRSPWWRIAVVVLAGAACFAGSHVVAGTLGAWPSVLVASLALGAVAFLLLDSAEHRAVGGRPDVRG